MGPTTKHTKNKKRKANVNSNWNALQTAAAAKPTKKVRGGALPNSNWNKLIGSGKVDAKKSAKKLQQTRVGAKRKTKTTNQTDPKPRPFTLSKPHHNQYISDDHPDFNDVIATSYVGFLREHSINQKLQQKVANALESMRSEGLFHVDCVLYGSRVSSTMVQRTLVGKPGTTYLYQKLRLFALPWTDNTLANGALSTIKDLNDYLSSRANEHIAKFAKSKDPHVSKCAGVGSAKFNLTLINASLGDASERYRQDKLFGMGSCAVNWHKDSSLQPFSAIGVYNHTPDSSNTSWQIAACVDEVGAIASGSKSVPVVASQKGKAAKSPKTDDVVVGAVAPAVSTALRDGDSYFMLGNFNHHHRHAVIAGQGTRYASTHRVAVQETDTWDYILNKCQIYSNLKHTKLNLDPKHIEAMGKLHSEIEFGWIRQFFVQGALHAEQQSGWWAPRIRKLEDVWLEMEQQTAKLADALLAPSYRAAPRPLQILAYIMTERMEQRKEWRRRYRDPVYAKLAKNAQPIERPSFKKGQLGWDLSPVIAKLNARVVKLRN